uniref:Uncharacterized protein n=1 Tax=Romanomermis culicivorax TaxID=13658 RepID=A0A915I150_ROMCU
MTFTFVGKFLSLESIQIYKKNPGIRLTANYSSAKSSTILVLKDLEGETFPLFPANTHDASQIPQFEFRQIMRQFQLLMQWALQCVTVDRTEIKESTLLLMQTYQHDDVEEDTEKVWPLDSLVPATDKVRPPLPKRVEQFF